MAWRESLIKLADYEIEGLRKRLKAIEEKRMAVDLVLASLDHEASEEDAHARSDAEAGWYLIGFREGWKQRRARAEADLHALAMEAEGARAALSEAFEAQKKYEQLAENARLCEAQALARRDAAALDDLARRRTGTW